MANNETGHAKNVANFENMVSLCVGYGAVYNPVSAGIKLDALQEKLAAANAVLQEVKVAKTAYNNATNAREILFLGLKKLTTRVANALAAAGASRQTVDDAKTVNRKIRGSRAKSIKVKTGVTSGDASQSATATEPEEKHISVAQQGFDNLTDHFTRLIQVVVTEASYAPNEDDLKVANLNSYAANLRASNTAVINAATAYSNALINRNNALYKAHSGMVDIALQVKVYAQSLFGAREVQARLVKGLQFTRLKA